MTPLILTIDALKRDGERIAPRTKKNSAQLIPGVMRAGKDGRMRQVPLLVPSPEYLQWHRAAVYSLRDRVFALHRSGLPTIAQPVNCRALIYRHADVGDAVGFYQGLADFLEHNYAEEGETPVRLLKNDKYIRRWWGSDLFVDKERPRIELVLEPIDVVGEKAATVGQKALFGVFEEGL